MRQLSVFPLLFLLLLTQTSASIIVPSTTYFGLPTYGTYINFQSEQTFDDIYRANDYWFFDGFGFQVQGANMTITSFFQNYVLTFTLNAPSGVSTTKIDTHDYGEPSSVSGTTNWTYSQGILTIQANHSSIVTITISFEAPEWNGFNLYFESGHGLSFQDVDVPYVLTLDVVSGTLNGTNGDLLIESGGIQLRGDLSFTSQDNASLLLSCDNGQVKLYVNEVPYDGTFSIQPNDNIHIRWELSWDVFVWTMPILGVVGAFCLVVSPYYIVTQLRKREFTNAWMYGLLLFILGFGLVIVWLWS
jgi:hypothetical protein